MKTFGIIFTLLILFSCNTSKNMTKITGVKWVLETMDNKKVQLNSPNSQVFVQFNEAEKRVNGMAGCNRFFGSYDMDGRKLSFSQMGSTRMACDDMSIETDFYKMLDDTDSFVIKDQKLTLMNRDKVVGVFRSAPLDTIQ